MRRFDGLRQSCDRRNRDSLPAGASSSFSGAAMWCARPCAALSKETAVRTAVASATDASDRLTFFAADLTRDEGWDRCPGGLRLRCFTSHRRWAATVSRDPNALVAPSAGRVAEGGFVQRRKRASSAWVMTSGPPPPRDQPHWFGHRQPTKPSGRIRPDRQFDAYRRSKIVAERAALGLHGRQHRPDHIGNHPFPARVFGPLLMRENLGSVQIIDRLLQGRPAGPSTPWILGRGRARPGRSADPRHDGA